jgi:thymidylate synthase
MKTIIGTTLGEVWIKSMMEVIDSGSFISDDSEMLKEVCNLYGLIRTIDKNDDILQKYADQDRIALMQEKYTTCGLVGDYKIDYGSYIYNNNGVNQIDWVKNRITHKPETKSATIVLHKPGEEKLSCLSLLDFKLRKGKLNMTAFYRSQNTFASLPGNLLALKNIQQYVADSLSVEIGVVELVVASAHIYEKDIQTAMETIANARTLL